MKLLKAFRPCLSRHLTRDIHEQKNKKQKKQQKRKEKKKKIDGAVSQLLQTVLHLF